MLLRLVCAEVQQIVCCRWIRAPADVCYVMTQKNMTNKFGVNHSRVKMDIELIISLVFSAWEHIKSVAEIKYVNTTEKKGKITAILLAESELLLFSECRISLY